MHVLCFKVGWCQKGWTFDVWEKKRPPSGNPQLGILDPQEFTGCWFQIYFFFFTLTWGRFPIWLLYIFFFRWVETPNQFSPDCKKKNGGIFWNVAHWKLESLHTFTYGSVEGHNTKSFNFLKHYTYCMINMYVCMWFRYLEFLDIEKSLP